jgi:hypothetical protein
MSLRFLDYRPMDETVVDVGNDGILHPQSSAANGALHIGVRQRERMKSSEVYVSGWLAYQNKRSSAYLSNFTTKWIASSFVPTSQYRGIAQQPLQSSEVEVDTVSASRINALMPYLSSTSEQLRGPQSCSEVVSEVVYGIAPCF